VGTGRLIDEGNPGKRKLSEAQIETLDAFWFPWVPTFTPPSSFEDRFEELRAFKGKFGHYNVVSRSASASQCCSIWI
jgi:hypothetical protein